MKENFFYFIFPSIVTGVFGFFLLIPVTTYYLDPADFGVFALLTALTMPIGPLSSTGVSWVLGGSFFKISAEQRRVLLFNVTLSDAVLKCFWVAIFWLAAPWILFYCLREVGPNYVFWFRLSLITVLLNAFWPTVSYHLVLSRKGSRHALFEILPWLAGTATTLFTLSVLGWKTDTLFWSPIIAGIVLLLMNLWHLWAEVTVRIDRTWLKEILTVGLPSVPASLVEMLRNSLDRIFLERWLSLDALGLYSHSLAYRNLFTVGTKAFSRVFSPHALEVFSKNQDHTPLDTRLNHWYTLIGVAGIPTVFFAEEVVGFLTHGKFTAAAFPVKIWFLLVLCFSYAIPYNSFLQEAKRTGFLATTDIVVNLVFLGLAIPAIYWGGVAGAALNYVAGNFCLQLVRHHASVKYGCREFSQRGLWTAILFLSLGMLITNGFQVSLLWKAVFAPLLIACNLRFSCITIAELGKAFSKAKMEPIS